MTTNFDRVYQNAAIALSNVTAKVKTYRDTDLALLARGDSKTRLILKVHGSIDDIGSMIFTRSDYIRLRNNYPLFQTVTTALAVTKNVHICWMRPPRP
jgi:hypothetical protein